MGSFITRQHIMNTSGSKQILQHERLHTHEQSERPTERVERKVVHAEEPVQPQARAIQQEISEHSAPTMGKDDFLLQQIDEFRNKAKQLQELVNKKENRAEKLQSILTRRQSEADSILKDFETKVQVLIDNVQACITTMNREVKEQVHISGQRTGEQIEEQVKKEIESLKAQLEQQMEKQMPEIEKISVRIDAQMAETEQLLLQAKQESQMANQQVKEHVEASIQQIQEQSGKAAERMQEQAKQVLQQTQEQSAQTFHKIQ